MTRRRSEQSSSATATVTAEGTNIAFEVTGDGPPVVLVHGLTESRRMWDPLVQPLAVDHSVVTVDLPGHGESGSSTAYDPDTLAGAVNAVIAETDIAQPLLVGHSFGGEVVTAMAGGSSQCRGVVNVDQLLDRSVAQSELKPMESALRGDEASFQKTIRAISAPLAGALNDSERARIEELRRPRQQVVLAIWAELFERNTAELHSLMRERSSGITVPYLSLHGGYPRDGYASWLTDLIPSAVVEVWPNRGHYPHLVEPERFLARLRSFEKDSARAERLRLAAWSAQHII